MSIATTVIDRLRSSKQSSDERKAAEAAKLEAQREEQFSQRWDFDESLREFDRAVRNDARKSGTAWAEKTASYEDLKAADQIFREQIPTRLTTVVNSRLKVNLPDGDKIVRNFKIPKPKNEAQARWVSSLERAYALEWINAAASVLAAAQSAGLNN